MKSCEQIQEDLTRRIQGDCDSLKEKELQEHLAGCPVCQRYWDDLRADDALLRKFTSSCDPVVARIRSQVMDRISQVDLSAQPAVASREFWVRYAVAAGLILAALLTTAIWVNQNRNDRIVQKKSVPSEIKNNIPNPVAYGTPQPPENLGDRAPLPIVLPVAMYRDTPRNLRGIENLEPPRGMDRPPFYAPKGATNVALGKPVTLSDENPILGEARLVTDGDKNAMEGCFVEMGPFAQSATINLQGEYEIYAILIWHFHLYPRSYRDVVVQVSMDPEFTRPVTLFNNDTDNSLGLGKGTDKHYVDTNEGRLVDAKGNRARFVRLYSNGNNENELNHLIEVEVWGKPAETPAPKPLGGYIPLPLVLPKPIFHGTPPNLRGIPNTEPYSDKPRPAYYVPAGVKNLALNKPVFSSDFDPINGEPERVTDGDKEGTDGSFVELGPFAQHITIDLEAEYSIYAIVVWHYHKEARIYSDVAIQVGADRDFIEAVTLFNSDIDNSLGLGVGTHKGYVEDYQGKLIDGKGTRGRYVRLYSSGNQANDLNHYIEVEVWGKPENPQGDKIANLLKGAE